MQNRNEMTTNVIKQTINVGFETPNRKTWNIGQLQKEAWKQFKAAMTTTPCNFIFISHVWFIFVRKWEYSQHSYSDHFS